MFDEYFLFGYQRLNAEGRSTFVTDKLRHEYYAAMNLEENGMIFDNKIKTYELFREYYKRDMIAVKTIDDYGKFCIFVKKHRNFLVKPLNSCCGRGVYKAEADELNVKDVFDSMLSAGGVVCEELIEQSDVMAQLHPQSVNTVRIPTIRTKKGIKIFHPFLRVGRNGSIVDNAGAGGLFPLVDADSGVVYSYAVDEAGKRYIKHPDTGKYFPGFQLPEWDKAVELVNKLSSVVPSNHYTGWDLAHSKRDGWIMVEGNRSGQLVMQYVLQNGLKNELEDIIKDI